MEQSVICVKLHLNLATRLSSLSFFIRVISAKPLRKRLAAPVFFAAPGAEMCC